jgi:ATP-dependent DNA ligase
VAHAAKEARRYSFRRSLTGFSIIRAPVACCRFHQALPASPADKPPPSGSNWIHKIKHDGYRLMVRRDPERTALASFRRSGCDGSCGSPAPIVARNVSLIAASIHTCA